jgi:hypothetical protein
MEPPEEPGPSGRDARTEPSGPADRTIVAGQRGGARQPGGAGQPDGAGPRRAGRLILIVALPLAALGAAAAELPDGVLECLECHEDPDAVAELEDGTEMSLYVDPDVFTSSIHGADLVCTDCHRGYDDDHPFEGPFPSRRAYVIASYEVCKECHFDTYNKTLESVHYELLKNSVEEAPVCTDCHGAHNVSNPHEKRAMVSRSCATCHDDVFQEYSHSVHGAALVNDDNTDVPACADCHTHHQIAPPHEARFRLQSPETCISCHGDAELMKPYGLSTDVATTYLKDFHGVTASLSGGVEVDSAQVVVTCVDCHGSHGMVSPSSVGPEAMKATVAGVCADCHGGASQDFPAAWLSHYKPSLSHAPLVFLVDVFYRIFIPFIVLGLVLQVLLHLYRVSAGR